MGLQERAFCRTAMIASFRAMVVGAFLAHATVLFVLPQMPSVFSSYSLELMKYGGHGARVAMNHPIIVVLYLIPFVAFFGLYFFKNWGRYLLASFLALVLIGSFFFGVSISGPPETFFGHAASLLDGGIMALAFLSPLRDQFAAPRSS